ncbi:MAG: hypothetical protein ACI849_000740, partial [Patiriisocius sp.]
MIFFAKIPKENHCNEYIWPHIVMAMKKILLICFVLTSFVSIGQITIDESLTAQELVEDILINSPCAEVTNVGQRTGTDFGNVNGIAAFDANGTSFPFSNGIILMTGDVSRAPGPNNVGVTLSDGDATWPGDPDLEANTTATNTNNASIIQFNFVPQIDQINFNFIFVSEEYNRNFECSFSDAFAFILTDQVTGVVQNLAVLPGTTTPIEVTNVRYGVPAQAGCNDINTQFFQQYNFEPTDIGGLPFVAAADAPIYFNGQTVPLTAVGDVVAGNGYNIKLVIADETDSAFDAAVFLEGGSFNIGVNLGPDVTIASGTALCEGETLEIGLTGLGGNPGDSTYQWSVLNIVTLVFDILPGETNPTLDVTISGTYQIEVTSNGSGCAGADEIVVEFAPVPVANQPDDLFQCDDGTQLGVFDLTVNDAVVIGAQDPALFIVKYYEEFLDSQAGFNEILIPTNYTIMTPPLQTIFVRIEDLAGGCFALEDFTLNYAQPVLGVLTDEDLCDEDSNGIVSVNLPVLKDVEALNGLDPLLYEITYHNTLVEANTDINPLPAIYNVTAPVETIFVRIESVFENTCFDLGNFTVNIFLAPGANIPTRYNLCDELPNDGIGVFDLPTKDLEITGGNPDAVVSYFTTFAGAQAGGFPIVPATAFVNSVIGFQIIYARVDNINATDCFNIVPLELQVNDSPGITEPITDYFLCDLDGDGLETFDLTTKDLEILNILVDVTLTYHDSDADAQVGLNPITPATAYISSNAVVWVRAVNYEDGDVTNPPLCFTVGQFNLILGQTPVFNVIPEIEACDDAIADGFTEFDLNSYNTSITGGDPTLTVTYHATQGDAENGVPAL